MCINAIRTSVASFCIGNLAFLIIKKRFNLSLETNVGKKGTGKKGTGKKGTGKMGTGKKGTSEKLGKKGTLQKKTDIM